MDTAEMNAYAVKSDTIFATAKSITRKPPSKSGREIARFIDSHDISVVFKDNECKINVIEKIK